MVLPIAAILLFQGPGSVPPKQDASAIQCGWHDELNDPLRWSDLAMDNKARLNEPSEGRFILSLGHVPANWPYEFQWSGVSQDAFDSIDRFPVLMARVEYVQPGSYAHMDIDVVDSSGKAVKTFRSSTLRGPGLSTIDFTGQLDPAFYHLRLRLIVGGDNVGCAATYDWVRFVSQKDAAFLNQHPDWEKVRDDRVWR